ncbi:sensor histidine kinase [Streptomyces fructofermentans]|uniref:Sensor-like histidine kinase SenX3 n=1 Tax=Streptomyces fructofermentans TaxID=152141 RepID=A0A918K7E0_9ACTN|nr:ATP-binding protein [Streptomyces fructofermentans]GGX52987.1 hypothetical protein GCM10010515_20480 [Streptomyces fructofermentans]
MTDDGPRELSEAVLGAAPDGVVALDPDGLVRACNPAAAALLERPTDELVGSVLALPLVDGADTEIALALPDGRSTRVAVRVARTRLAGRPLYVAVLRDADPAGPVPREEQALRAALVQQSVVAAVAAHQLHNPLAALSALVHVLGQPPPGMTDERRADLVARIAERTARLQALVRKLLTAARIDGAWQQGVPETLRVRDFLLERLAESDTRARDLTLDVPGHLVARADPVGFAEIFTNYLENALVHGREPVVVTARGTGGRVEVRVADHGPGVPVSFVPHLFERYRREPAAAAATEGTGLGLWIAGSLARANGGDAWYEPGRAGGAVFCVSLPGAGAEHADVPQEPPSTRA